jgi:hypothetical protein
MGDTMPTDDMGGVIGRANNRTTIRTSAIGRAIAATENITVRFDITILQ